MRNICRWCKKIIPRIAKIICHAKIYHSVAENLKRSTILIVHPSALFDYPIPVKCKILIRLHPTPHIAMEQYIGSTTHLVQQSCMRFNAIIVGLAYQAQAQKNYSYK